MLECSVKASLMRMKEMRPPICLLYMFLSVSLTHPTHRPRLVQSLQS